MSKVAEWSNAYRQRYPERCLHRAAKSRAKKRNIIFNLDYSDIVIPEVCPILNIPIVLHAGITGTKGGKMNSPSLDRVDPSKGYTKGNVQVVSHLANSMKSNASPEQLKRFSKWVRSTYGD